MLRRDLIVGSACVAAAGAAFVLSPRQRVSRLGAAKLREIVPVQVAGWKSHDVSGLAPPSRSDDLVAKLYDQVTERVFTHQDETAQITMLLAHGASQTNELELHRPEVCYPAFGYRLRDNHTSALPVAPGVLLPIRRFVAESASVCECVLYWTRIGDSLPTDGAAQRMARLASAFEGVVCDGLLARFSVVNDADDRAFALLVAFIPQFLASVRPGALPALVGRGVAGQLGAELNAIPTRQAGWACEPTA